MCPATQGVFSPMNTQNPIRTQKRKLAVHLLTMSQPVFNPITELFADPLLSLDEDHKLRDILIYEIKRQTGISVTKMEARIMLQTASGLSTAGIAEMDIKTLATVSHQRKMLWHKFRDAYPELDYRNEKIVGGSPKLGKYDQTAVLALITIRILNQMI